jgi:microcompartment protein CcmL/EutN
MYEAMGLIETNSIPAGIEAGDAMLKAAQVELVAAQAVCAGKFIVLVRGDVAAVKASVEAGVELAGGTLVKDMVIPNVHRQVLGAIGCCVEIHDPQALGIVETFSIAAAVLIADAAVKAADVELIEIRLGRGLGGKSFILLTGDVAAVRFAVDAGTEPYKNEGLIARTAVIPAPHPDIMKAIM